MAKKHQAASWKDRLERGGSEATRQEAERHKRIMDTTTEADTLGDLRLSPLEYRDPRELRVSPYNTDFEPLKTPSYWEGLRRDIEEAGAITDPLLILPDGEIVSGHSRLKVALDLLGEGRREFEKVPVRVVLSELAESEKRKRVYLGNLSRFEIDANTRLRLYAVIYPEYFQEERTAGQRTKTDPTEAVAADLGVKPRQVRNERAIYQDAKKRAATRGKREPEAVDLEAARKARNQARRKRQTATVAVSGKAAPARGSKLPQDAPEWQKENERAELRQAFVEAAFLTALQKAAKAARPVAFLDGVEAVARELHGGFPLKKTLKRISAYRRRLRGE